LFNYYNIKEVLKPEEIIMYLRKSRADDPLLTIEEVLRNHETRLDEWCERNLNGLIPVENRYKEIVSGESISDRPVFQQVLKLIEKPNIKAVIVAELSRLGRPDTMEIGMISKIFRFTSTIVITPEKIFDITDEFEREMFENELKRGNFYLEYSKKILKAGREMSVKSGNYVCSKPPYGYDKTYVMDGKRKCPTLTINEVQAIIVRQIFNSYANENIGFQTIGDRLNDMGIKSPQGKRWTVDAVRSIVENPVYIGMVRWNERKAIYVVEDGEFRKTRPKTTNGEKIYCEGKHEAIVSDELFQLAQEKRGKAHRTSGGKELKNPIASLLYCECGRAMSYRQSTYPDGRPKGTAKFVCNGQHFCGNGSCDVDEVIEVVIKTLKQRIADFDMETHNTDNSDNFHEKQLKKLEKDLADINGKEIAMWESQFDTDESKRVPQHIFNSLTEKLSKERWETENAIANIKEILAKPITYEKQRANFQKALDALLDDKVSVADKNHLLKACIERVEYHREKPEKLRGKGVGRQWTTPPIELKIKLKV
jgi:DNA invertase Pin-like site-specific DNA recombinase